jgi:transcription initiation factor TFIIA large subunit
MASNYHQIETPPLPQTQSAFTLPPLPPMQPEARIKAEPGTENGLSLPSYNPPSTGLTAQQRAAQNLQATYGARAAASIHAIQGNIPQQGQQQNMQQNMQQQQQQQRSGGAPMQRPQMSPAQYQQALAEAAAQRRAQLQSTGNAQTDGADEIDGEPFGIVKHINSQGQEVKMGRVEIDSMIRQRIEAMGKRMEGGGLMLPLKKRKVNSSGIVGSDPGSNPLPNFSSSSYAPAQFDGGDEDDDSDNKDLIKDEDLDEDAINSDLDDPDDGANDDDEDDENLGHIMLCMYDKVQRVKNKWYATFPIVCHR